MKSKIRENKRLWTLFEYVGILFGTFLTAVAVIMFMIPNKLAPGGYSGVATVLYYTAGLPVGTMTFVLSVATQLISVKVLGKSIGLKSFVCTLSYGVMVDLMNGHLPEFSDDVLLSSIFAGVLYGVGLGILFRMGGSGGGTDLLARMLHKFTRRMSLSTWLMCVDFCVIILAGVAFRDLPVMLYSIIVLFLYTQVMNFVIVGNNYSKAANIVSEHSREICDRIRDELNKSATIFHAYGAYSGESKDVIYCIVYRNQIAKLKHLIYEVDPTAFVTLSDVQEVLGQGFKSIDEE